jgi:hypothetical protein
MPRVWKIAIAVLALLVFAALLTFPALLRNVLGLRRANRSEEQVLRAIVPPISTPSDTREKAQLFWLSPTSRDTLESTTVELDLSADVEERAKQLIAALIEKPPSQIQRTLPADALLLQFYLLPGGTAIADFSETLGTETPSGILNEEMAVDSIVRTLGTNLTSVYRLKILIRGQEAETLAGHLDLSEFFNVTPQTQPQPAAAGAASNDQPVEASPLGGSASREQPPAIVN